MIKCDIEDLIFSNQTNSMDRESSLHQNTWTYSVYDQVRKPTVAELRSQYELEGYDSLQAYSKALDTYEKNVYSTDKILHEISDVELASIPKQYKNKPSGIGRYYWRAPAFQHLEIGYSCEDPFREYAQLLLGDLQEGDRLPVRMKPKSPFGYEMEYLTFVGYKHTFPTNKHYIHAETLTFMDSFGKRVQIRGAPTYLFRDKSWDTVIRVADILSFWNMCRNSNEESLFGDLYKILLREKCLSWTKREGMIYHKDFENHPSIIEQPICLLRTL